MAFYSVHAFATSLSQATHSLIHLGRIRTSEDVHFSGGYFLPPNSETYSKQLLESSSYGYAITLSTGVFSTTGGTRRRKVVSEIHALYTPEKETEKAPPVSQPQSPHFIRLRKEIFLSTTGRVGINRAKSL